MTIGTDGVTDWFNWYQIWEVGVALNGVCVRSGRSGTQARLGESTERCRIESCGIDAV